MHRKHASVVFYALLCLHWRVWEKWLLSNQREYKSLVALFSNV
jgi:hypothetical protein